MLRIYGVEKDKVNKPIDELTNDEKIELAYNTNEVYTVEAWFRYLNSAENGIDTENYYWFALNDSQMF